MITHLDPGVWRSPGTIKHHKEDTPTPEEGEIGWGPSPTFEPWEDTGWEPDSSQRLRISNNSKTATALLEMTRVAVLGKRIFSSGLHAWTVTIDVSRLNYGGAMCIGVTDAAAAVGPDRGGWSCGFNPYCGAFFATSDAFNVNYQSPAHSLMHGDLQGKANKATVTVMVDMNQRQLAFSINGGPSVLATEANGLPSTVRPWVHLFKEHDSVTIGSPQGLAHAGTPSPPGPEEAPEEGRQLFPRSTSGCSSFGTTSRDANACHESSANSLSSVPLSRSFGSGVRAPLGSREPEPRDPQASSDVSDA